MILIRLKLFIPFQNKKSKNLRKLIEIIIAKKDLKKNEKRFVNSFLYVRSFACVYNIEMIKLFLNAVIIRLLNGNLLAAH